MAAADLTDEVPVVIAGAGPAGLVAAITLARNGIGSLRVERNPGLSPLPRGTAVSTRTMELLRSWGLEEIANASPATPAAVPQDHLEPVLPRHLDPRAGRGPVRHRADRSRPGRRRRHRGAAGAAGRRRADRPAGYLVGGDGAHSGTRRLLGVAMDDPDHLNEQLTALFEAPWPRSPAIAATASTSSSTRRPAASWCPTAPATGGCTAELGPAARTAAPAAPPGEDVAPGPEALNGRLAHAWLPATTTAATLDTPFPMTVHTLDPATADAQPIAHCPPPRPTRQPPWPRSRRDGPTARRHRGLITRPGEGGRVSAGAGRARWPRGRRP